MAALGEIPHEKNVRQPFEGEPEQDQSVNGHGHGHAPHREPKGAAEVPHQADQQQAVQGTQNAADQRPSTSIVNGCMDAAAIMPQLRQAEERITGFNC